MSHLFKVSIFINNLLCTLKDWQSGDWPACLQHQTSRKVSSRSDRWCKPVCADCLMLQRWEVWESIHYKGAGPLWIQSGKSGVLLIHCTCVQRHCCDCCTKPDSFRLEEILENISGLSTWQKKTGARLNIKKHFQFEAKLQWNKSWNCHQVISKSGFFSQLNVRITQVSRWTLYYFWARHIFCFCLKALSALSIRINYTDRRVGDRLTM